MITVNYINKRLLVLIPLVGMLIFSMFLLSYGFRDIDLAVKQVILSILNTATIWLGCMVIVQFLWWRYPWEQNPVKHLIIEIVAILVYTLSVSGLLYLLATRFWNMEVVNEPGPSILITLLITFLITAIHEGVFFYNQWKFNFSKSVRLERDNIEARYEALRSQVNPHFLFNSLNSLVSLVEDNKEAVGYIRNLSELLRYMLRSNEKELVLLRDEIAVLNNYLTLQKMRFGENLLIDNHVTESCFHYAVPPLALQMLVENAIKHNVITKEKPLKISLWVEKDILFVENTLQIKEVMGSTKQGLKNINGRYRLFTSRTVKIDETNGCFKAGLPLLQVEL
jgi:two-component system, LytTR family, sensor kinase